jgi:hypothetical protein
VPNTLEEIAGTLGISVGELIFAILREGAIGGAVLSVIAFLLSRFIREIYGRALLAIFCSPRPGHTSDSPFWLLRVRFGS